MEAYRTFLTVTDSHQIVLKDVPFQPGQPVEILVLAQRNEIMVQEMERLFKETQSLSQIKSLTDEEITAEVNAFRCNQ